MRQSNWNPGSFLLAGLVILMLCGGRWAMPEGWSAAVNPVAAVSGEKTFPVIELGETESGFGELLEGETASHDFIVKNTGSAPLVINKVTPG